MGAKSYDAAYYAKNRDVILRRNRQYRANNRVKISVSKRRYYEQNLAVIREKAKRRYEANPGKFRLQEIRRVYGLSSDQVAEILESQDGRCAICQTPLEKPHVDHCHETGRVRAFLCNRCNVAIGMLGEDSAVIYRAAAYVSKHKDISELIG